MQSDIIITIWNYYNYLYNTLILIRQLIRKISKKIDY